jgi:hypothetical protein
MQAEGWSKEIQSTLVQFQEAASRNDIAAIAASNTLDYAAKWPTQEEVLRLAIECYPKRTAALQAIEHSRSELLDEDFLVRIGQAIYKKRTTRYSRDEMSSIINHLYTKLGLGDIVSVEEMMKQIDEQFREKRPREQPAQEQEEEPMETEQPTKKKPAAKKKSPLDCKELFELLRQRCIGPPREQALVEAAAGASCTSVQDMLQIVLANGSLDQKTAEFKQMLLSGCFIAYCRKDNKSWEYIADRLNIPITSAKSHSSIVKSHALYQLVVDRKMYKLRLLAADTSTLAALRRHASNEMPKYLAANPEELEWWSQGPPPPTIQVDNGSGEMIETIDIWWLN